jgi:hypothetical protein
MEIEMDHGDVSSVASYEDIGGYHVKMYLNTALCQSPAEVSKTQKSIDYIRHFSILARANSVDENGVHHITIVLTNNNLSETSQWKLRLQSKFRGEGVNCIILSSKKGSEIQNLDQLWGRMARCKNASALPDLILMCTNGQRTEDVIDMISTLKNGRFNFSNIGIERISTTIMFDEADKNIKVIKTCLSSLNNIMTISAGSEKIDDVIRDIHFITATPLAEFWKVLKKCGIEKLSNINHALKTLDENSTLNTPYLELMKGYRYLKDHNLYHDLNDPNCDPVDYARQIVDTVLASKTYVKTIFAPSKNTLSSHEKMLKMLQSNSRNYVVYVDNSSKNGKCFHYLDGRIERLDEFNKRHNIKGELRDTFVKWRELNPSSNLAITGYLNIIRGITFNTIGFNFTDIIISGYHANDIASLIQLFGRANGDVRFIGVMNIYCPQCVWNTVDEQVKLMDDILNKDPTEFQERHFRKKTERERSATALTIPRVFSVDKERFDMCVVKKGREYDMSLIFALIEHYDSELVSELKKIKKIQVTQPNFETAKYTYKKYITDCLNAARENKTYSVGIHKDDKKLDGYQMFLDNQGHNIIVCVHNGSRISDDDEDD